MKEIKINDIHLALWNPRFETIDKLDFDYVKYFNKWDKNYSLQEEALKISELIKENIDKYKELFDSIKAFFHSNYEKIKLIKSKDSYIVVDGNRRISCLKILMNYEKYQKCIYEILKGEINVESTNEFISKLSVLYIFIEQNKNEFVKPTKILLNFNEYTIYSSNNQILNLVPNKDYRKNSIGYLPWNKGKYYYDIWTIFNNERLFNLADIDDKKISQIFGKDKKMIYEEYKKAVFLFQLFSEPASKNRELSIRDYFILIPPEQYDPVNISQMIENLILYINKNVDVKKHINLYFDAKNRWYINKGHFEIKNILKFINELRESELQISKFNKKEIGDSISIFYKHLNLINDKQANLNKEEFVNNFLFMSENELRKVRSISKNTNILNLIDERIYQFSISQSIIKNLKVKKVDILIKLASKLEEDISFKESKSFINTIQLSIKPMLELIVKLMVFNGIYEYKSDVEYLKFINSFLTDKDINKKSLNDIKDHLFDSKISLLTNIDKLWENKVFRNSFNQFFNRTSDIKDFYNFISENWEWINSKIKNITGKDFKIAVETYKRLISKNNEILLKFLLTILINLNKNMINKLASVVNKTKQWAK
uniref:DUF262 domain-containing protein n=1 Tax=Mycoplasma anserisalpingitidis TaxID=519450 RepID=A0A8F2DF66_9MOLU|nr:hypothetical protein [Mycoplasma anserisalpingitidis]